MATDSSDYPEHYPLEVDTVGVLGPDEISRHIDNLASYLPAMTLVELRRREILRTELKRCTSPPSMPPPSRQRIQTNHPSNKFALTGMILGFLSIFMWIIGGIPVAAIIISRIGITKAKDRGGKGKGQATIGLGLGLLFFLLHLMMRLVARTNS